MRDEGLQTNWTGSFYPHALLIRILTGINLKVREGQGDYVQQQGPFPQQLEADKVGFIVAQVGDQIGPCGFSSLAAHPEWLETDMGKAFVRAYKETRI